MKSVSNILYKARTKSFSFYSFPLDLSKMEQNNVNRQSQTKTINNILNFLYLKVHNTNAENSVDFPVDIEQTHCD